MMNGFEQLSGMKRNEFEKLVEIRQGRELTGAESARVQTWLAEHPEDLARWIEEDLLSGALASLPDKPIASNFTSQVWQGIEQAEKAPRPLTAGWPGKLAALLGKPGFAVGAACAVVLVIVLQRPPVKDTPRSEFADSLVAMSELPVPTVEMLRDFDAINTLGQPMLSGDWELLAVLEKE